MPERLSRPEFIALMAMLIATVAFSTDAMLPAFPEIAQELSPEAPNRAQLIIGCFILGMGAGTFFVGPMSDAYGRKPVILFGASVYVVMSAIAAFAPTIETLLVARFFQGVAASAPRVVSHAIIRDLFQGRRMAQLMSLVMMIFSIIPAAAPAVGALIISFAGWRGVFWSFVVFSAVSATWFAFRQSETLAPENRIPFRLTRIKRALSEVRRAPNTVPALLVLSVCLGMLMTLLTTIQPMFDITYGRADEFHLWFALVALVAAGTSILNSRIVMRFGMLKIASTALLLQIFVSGTVYALGTILGWGETFMFPIFVCWCGSVFIMISFCLGNLNALAMVPLGHVAGTAASVLGAISTIAGITIATPIGLMFNGTPAFSVIGIFVCATVGYVVTWFLSESAYVEEEEAAS